MPTSSPPPDLPLEHLRVHALIDYVKVHCEVNYSAVVPETDRLKWMHRAQNDDWIVTLQEPDPAGLRRLGSNLLDPLVFGLEISVDFWPVKTVTGKLRHELLEQTYTALAARFRPEERLLYGAGFKGAISDAVPKPTPFHMRIGKPTEELVYGHREEGQNAKLYLKNRDGGAPLPPKQHRVRMEITLKRWECMTFEIDRLSDLGKGRLRRHAAQVFRIIDRPDIRHPGKRSERDRSELESAMTAHWNQAGVGAFDAGALPPDSSLKAKQAAAYRKVKLLSATDYRLRRHTAANTAIGDALRNLDRRMKTTFPGGMGGADPRSEVT